MTQSTKRARNLLGVFIAIACGLFILKTSPALPDGLQGSFASMSQAGASGSVDPEVELLNTVAVTRGSVRQTVIAPGQTNYLDTVFLSTKVGGQVAKILVRPGDVVHQGTVIADLDPAQLEAALKTAQLEQQRAEAEYQQDLFSLEWTLQFAKVKHQTAIQAHKRGLSEAELLVRMAQLRLDQARLNYPIITSARVRLNSAIESEKAAAKEYEEAVERRNAQWEPPEISDSYLSALEAARDAREIAEANYLAVVNSQAANSALIESLEAELQLAQIGLDSLQAGVDPLLEMEMQKAEVALDDLLKAGIDQRFQFAVDQALSELEAAKMTSPFDGIVLEVQVAEGETVLPGQALFLIADPTSMEVNSTVIEEDLPRLEIGQKAELFFDAIPEAIFQGHVTQIYPQRLPFQERPLYRVSIQLDELPPSLTSGMTADATIVIQERQEVLRLPRALMRAGTSEIITVSIWNGADVEEHDIRLGMRGDVYIEIEGGLREGDQVIGK